MGDDTRTPWTGRLTVRCEFRIRSPRDSERSQVRCFRRRSEKAAVRRVLDEYEPPDVAGKPPGALVCTFTRFAAHPLDDDALAYAYKSFRDAVADWAGTKDGPKDPIKWQYAQERWLIKEPNPRCGRRREGPTRYQSFTTISLKSRRI
jgi:hypothetical protein